VNVYIFTLYPNAYENQTSSIKMGGIQLKTLFHLYYYYKCFSKKLKPNKSQKYPCLLNGKLVNGNIFNYFSNLFSHLLWGYEYHYILEVWL